MASSVFLWFNGITGGGNINTGDGTAAADAYGYSANAGLGQYRIGTNNEGFSAGAALIFDYNTTRVLFAQPILGVDGLVSSPGFAYSGEPNTGWYRNGGGTISFASAGTRKADFAGASLSYAGEIDSTTSFGLRSSIGATGIVFISNTAPTIASGFGTSPAIAASNGTAAFTITIGSSPGSTGVLTFPAATTGWVVTAGDLTTPGVNVTKQTAGSTTSVTLTNYNSTLGTAANWTAGDTLICTAMAY